ncbi:MAG: cupin domain-containing protein [Gammaproteobacteria bacterium]|nr:cupin domain-containing protein [Gammaproteobacteria bacterium]MDH4255408.1 cupin domain-containing protein [Gammaproteobacteria bacterium]MDH5311359.1 cupin domain-containing protein [Gammaproteobacteria bacterium]
MQKPVINIDELEYKTFGKGEKFRAERAPVSSRIGAKKLGYSVIRLQPGKRAWPYHSHYVIEEMIYILSGTGTLRHAGAEYPVRAGDFICSPADPEQPHQVVNTSEGELCYIVLSTQDPTDVFLYPDSGKYGVWHGNASDPSASPSFLVFARKDTAVDYWDGEV